MTIATIIIPILYSKHCLCGSISPVVVVVIVVVVVVVVGVVVVVVVVVMVVIVVAAGGAAAGVNLGSGEVGCGCKIQGRQRPAATTITTQEIK